MNILVIGERCLDVYNYGRVTKINAEAPTPVMELVKTEKVEGMAGNVWNNLRSLRPEWNIDFIHQSEIITKTRYVDEASGYILLRMDSNDSISEQDEFDFRIKDYSKYDAIVISSYNKGFLDPRDIADLSTIYKGNKKIPVFLDCKFNLDANFAQVDFVKINNREYKALANIHCHNLLVTKGKDGVEWHGKLYPAPQVEVRCLTGAGDVFLACFVVKYMENPNGFMSHERQRIEDAINYANSGAAYSVTKNGTTVVKETDFLTE